MLISDDFASLYSYNAWANERTVASCRSLSREAYEKPLGSGWTSVRDTLVHIASGTQAWFDRFRGNSPSRLLTGADIPELEDAAALLKSADEALTKFVVETPESDRVKVLAYTNVRGEVKKVPYWAVFRHAVNHATYHRGQIATMVRMLGGEPKSTDFVFWGILNTPQD